MKLAPSDLDELARRAAEAAVEAGAMIAGSRPQQVDRKAGGASLASQVVTEIDRRSEDIVLGVLAPTRERFELGLLTEEREDDGGRLRSDHFWCIDPLDGTLPFVEGTPGYSVSIALVRKDGTPLIGVVLDPVTMTLIQAVRGGGVRRNGEPWEPATTAPGGELTLYADRSAVQRDDHDETVTALEDIAHDLGLDGVRVDATRGGVMNACAVLAHPPACYFKRPGPTGGGSLWDFAATACIFFEAGAVATDIHGDGLDLNRADSTFMNHRGVLYATDEVLASRLYALARG